MIDMNFDFRKDSECGDPDNDSQKLYENHKILWNKILPNEKIFELEILMLGGKYGRIVLKNNYVQIYLVTECALILMENIT